MTTCAAGHSKRGCHRTYIWRLVPRKFKHGADSYRPTRLAAHSIMGSLEFDEERLQKRWHMVFNYYADLAGSYSLKLFTFECDVLDAFDGIMTAFEKRFDWTFYYGLPAEAFEYAPLWTARLPLRRQRGPGSQSDDQFVQLRRTFPS